MNIMIWTGSLLFRDDVNRTCRVCGEDNCGTEYTATNQSEPVPSTSRFSVPSYWIPLCQSCRDEMAAGELFNLTNTVGVQ